jgi:hypothetical protein
VTASGSVNLRVIAPSGFTLSTGNTGLITLTLTTGATSTGNNFALTAVTDPDPDPDPDPVGTGTIRGFVFEDVDGFGWRAGTEPGISGVRVYVDLNNNASFDAAEPSALSTATGAFSVTTPTGLVKLRIVAPAGFNPAANNTGLQELWVDSGDLLTDKNFAYVRGGGGPGPNGNGVVSGFVFEDLDGFGWRESGEPGIAGARVYVDTNNNARFDTGEPSATSSPSGAYSISVAQGLYSVRIDDPTGFSKVSPNTGVQELWIEEGSTLTDKNFAYKRGGGGGATHKDTGAISGFVFRDTGGFGWRSGSEPGIAGVRVYVDANNNGAFDASETSVLSTATGSYVLTNLPGGLQRIRAVTPADFTLVAPSSGVQEIWVTPGENETDKNFGYTARVVTPTGGTISGAVYEDANNNNWRDTAETGLGNVVVYVDTNNDSIFQAGEPSTSTNSLGEYAFTNLPDGNYRFRLVIPTGFRISEPGANLREIWASAGFVDSDKNFGLVRTSTQPPVVPPTTTTVVNGGIYEIEPSVAVGRRLTVQGPGQGSNIFTQTDANLPSQRWQAIDVGGGFFELAPQNNPSFRLDVLNASTAQGAPIAIWPDLNGSNQRFRFTSVGNGLVEITPAHATGSRIDVSGGSSANGTVIWLWPSNSTPAQRWKLFPVASGEGIIDNRSTISGTVYNDTNRNGGRSRGEAGRSGVVVFIDANRNGVRDSNERSTTTDASGQYRFNNLVGENRYAVRILAPSGQTARSLVQDLFVDSGQSKTGTNFGLFSSATIR